MLNAISGIPYKLVMQLSEKRTPPPASPQAPGFTPVPVERGPNNFRLGVKGPDPLFAVGGTHKQQQFQRDMTIALATHALASYSSNLIPNAPRLPSDDQVAKTLAKLDPNPPIGIDGTDVTHAVYQSNIPAAPAQEAYEHFVHNPQEVFGAGGMEIRPATDMLQDRGRYMLEIGGPVPTWLPVEFRLDPDKNAITINTLDGHVLRGEQTFTFTDDGEGGTVLTQDARFQVGSQLSEELQQLTSISEGQHAGWQEAHRELYEQFNGDRDYEGMGLGLFNQQQLSTWTEALNAVRADPGTAADVNIDSGGVVANAGIDAAGWIANRIIDGVGDRIGRVGNQVGVPSSDHIRDAYDTWGNITQGLTDKVGDRVEGLADKLGDHTEGVVNSILARAPDIRQIANQAHEVAQRAVEISGPVGQTGVALADDMFHRLPFSESIHASYQALILGRDQISLTPEAIEMVKRDSGFTQWDAANREAAKAAVLDSGRHVVIVGDASAADFDLSLAPGQGSSDPVQIDRPNSVELGGKRGSIPMSEQATRFLDLGDPEIRKTWGVGFNDLTWLVRHCRVDAAYVVENGQVVQAHFNLEDVLDLRSQTGRSGMYNLATEVSGRLWHDMLGAPEATVRGSFSLDTVS